MTPPFTSDLAAGLAEDVLDRFLRYVRVDTQSARDRSGSPSTPGQLDLSRMLVDELRGIGLEDADLDDNGYVMATLPSTTGRRDPVVGLIAHVDTSPDAPGAGVEPIVHRAYDGGVIELPHDGTALDPEPMPQLRDRAGHDLVTSSGNTLLGADDKAGVAEIMGALAHLATHPELPRPTLRACFTPDEEVGEGATLFDIERFGALGAYTMDGSDLGELQDETFAAKEAIVTIHGVDVHPGFAKGKLVNAARLAARVIAALPSDTLTPETTDGREGYLHPYELEATAVKARFRVLLRDFDDDVLAEHERLLRRTAEEVVAAEPRARLEIEVTDQYPNMRSYLEPYPEIVAAAERAIRAEGVEVLHRPIRGGTDGSVLSARGLPTPNIFAGGHEFHSVREWVSVQDMAAAAAVIVRLAGEWARTGEGGD
jgi:tripeptide aminopeptidase